MEQLPTGVNYHTKSHPDKNQYHLFYPPNERELSDEDLRKEYQFIKDSLHCDSVRVVGHWREELLRAGKIAKEVGLQTWFSPRFVNATFDHTKKELEQFCQAALAAGMENVPLIVANELLFDCSDVSGIPIPNYSDRVKNYVDNYLKKGRRLNNTDKIRELVSISRNAGWRGIITYAAYPEEDIDWGKIDDPNLVIGVNLYWRKHLIIGLPWSDEKYDQKLKEIKAKAGNRKVVITEFGAVPQKGSLGKGGGGYHDEGKLDYKAQQAAYERYLRVLRNNGVGYFAYAFSEPKPGREHQNFALVLPDEKGLNTRLTPAAEVFSRFNKQTSSPHGVVIDER